LPAQLLLLLLSCRTSPACELHVASTECLLLLITCKSDTSTTLESYFVLSTSSRTALSQLVSHKQCKPSCLQLCCSGQQGPACKVALKIKRYLIMLCAMSPRHASSLHLVSNNACSTMAWHCLGGQPAKPTASACSRCCFWLVAFCAVLKSKLLACIVEFDSWACCPGVGKGACGSDACHCTSFER